MSRGKLPRKPRVGLCATTHLALLVQWFYGERISSYVNDHSQLEPVCGVGRPHWLPILHGLPPVSAGTLLWREGQKEEGGRHKEKEPFFHTNMQS